MTITEKLIQLNQIIQNSPVFSAIDPAKQKEILDKLPTLSEKQLNTIGLEIQKADMEITNQVKVIQAKQSKAAEDAEKIRDLLAKIEKSMIKENAKHEKEDSEKQAEKILDQLNEEKDEKSEVKKRKKFLGIF
jgi:TPP-dependent indolepyruvate ferredoxin oxidoreductase alpha subunit